MSIASSLKSTGIAEVMVVLKPAKQETAAAATAPQKVARHFKTSPFSQDNALLEQLKATKSLKTPRIKSREPSALALGTASPPDSKVRFYPHLGIALGVVDRAGLAALRKEDSVAAVIEAPQLRLIKPVASAAAAPKNGYTWGLRALGVDVLHKQGYKGKGILIGHLDTGVDASHPALSGAVKKYAEFDALGNQLAKAKPRDSDEHGTHTAGTIAGRPVNGVSFGVAPEASLASAMVIEGGNVLARILGGMNWAVGQRVRVLSMSLGLIGTKDTFLFLTRILRARNVLPVFAIGNEGAGTSRYPGNYAEALSVGAMQEDGLIADFSGSQRFLRKADPLVPDVVGPGVDVVSCVPGGSYKEMSGSSMATPHIAGLAALLMQARPGKSIAEIEAAIFMSCSLKPGMLPSRANRGLPDGVKALSLL
ncbi:S8 family serine peptidase [Pseudoduganella sp. LjRoot289]|uniref:S8 family peptidase n=1 Tax=Pseudoduganella sp. LjRoot289 TaxID=3342314 RepID=UPI003ECE1018